MSKREREARRERLTNASAWANTGDAGTFTPTAIKLPEGVERWKPEPPAKPTVFALDFIPYVAGEGDPNADEGFMPTHLEYEVHKVPGLDGKLKYFLCSYKMFGEKCAACHWLNRFSSTADEEIVKKVKSQRRCLWIVNDKPGDEKNPLKVFDSNYRNRGRGFAEQMKQALLVDADYGEGVFHYQDGYTVKLTGVKETFNSIAYLEITRIDFVKRNYDYPKSYFLKKSFSLYDCLIRPDYAEVEALLEGKDPADAAPTRNGNGRPAPAPEAEYEEGDEVQWEYKNKTVSGTVKSVDLDKGVLVVQCEDRIRSVDLEEPTLEKAEGGDEKEEAPAPKTTARDTRKAGGKATTRDDDEEEEEEEEEEDSTGIEIGSMVMHKKLGKCEITDLSKDGKTAQLEDDDGDLHPNIKVNDLTLVEDDEDEEPAPAPARNGKGGKAPAPAAKDEDDEDEDGDEEEDDEEEEGDEDEEEEDEDDDEPVRGRKPAGKKPAGKR